MHGAQELPLLLGRILTLCFRTAAAPTSSWSEPKERVGLFAKDGGREILTGPVPTQRTISWVWVARCFSFTSARQTFRSARRSLSAKTLLMCDRRSPCGNDHPYLDVLARDGLDERSVTMFCSCVGSDGPLSVFPRTIAISPFLVGCLLDRANLYSSRPASRGIHPACAAVESLPTSASPVDEVRSGSAVREASRPVNDVTDLFFLDECSLVVQRSLAVERSVGTYR